MYKLLIFLIALFLVVSIEFKVIDLSKLSKKYITVEINGAISNPGFYSIKKGSNINDLLALVNVEENADLSTINKQLELSDKDILYIPIKQETALVSINTASLNQLMMLPGIGEVTAKKIIEYRENKLFQSIEELKNVSGIGDAKYEAICLLISL